MASRPVLIVFGYLAVLSFAAPAAMQPSADDVTTEDTSRSSPPSNLLEIIRHHPHSEIPRLLQERNYDTTECAKVAKEAIQDVKTSVSHEVMALGVALPKYDNDDRSCDETSATRYSKLTSQRDTLQSELASAKADHDKAWKVTFTDVPATDVEGAANWEQSRPEWQSMKTLRETAETLFDDKQGEFTGAEQAVAASDDAPGGKTVTSCKCKNLKALSDQIDSAKKMPSELQRREFKDANALLKHLDSSYTEETAASLDSSLQSLLSQAQAKGTSGSTLQCGQSTNTTAFNLMATDEKLDRPF